MRATPPAFTKTIDGLNSIHQAGKAYYARGEEYFEAKSVRRWLDPESPDTSPGICLTASVPNIYGTVAVHDLSGFIPPFHIE